MVRHPTIWDTRTGILRRIPAWISPWGSRPLNPIFFDKPSFAQTYVNCILLADFRISVRPMALDFGPHGNPHEAPRGPKEPHPPWEVFPLRGGPVRAYYTDFKFAFHRPGDTTSPGPWTSPCPVQAPGPVGSLGNSPPTRHEGYSTFLELRSHTLFGEPPSLISVFWDPLGPMGPLRSLPGS